LILPYPATRNATTIDQPPSTKIPDNTPTIKMESRATQTDPDLQPKTPFSFAANRPEYDYLEEPLGHTALDPYGRRSMAFRRKATGEIVTQTQLNEEAITERPLLNFFRRQDAFMCFMLFEDVRPAWLQSTMGLVCLLFLLMPYMAWANVMVRWDVRRERRREEAKGSGGKVK
jgi:hypothetical protein